MPPRASAFRTAQAELLDGRMRFGTSDFEDRTNTYLYGVGAAEGRASRSSRRAPRCDCRGRAARARVSRGERRAPARRRVALRDELSAAVAPAPAGAAGRRALRAAHRVHQPGQPPARARAGAAAGAGRALRARGRARAPGAAAPDREPAAGRRWAAPSACSWRWAAVPLLARLVPTSLPIAEMPGRGPARAGLRAAWSPPPPASASASCRRCALRAATMPARCAKGRAAAWADAGAAALRAGRRGGGRLGRAARRRPGCSSARSGACRTVDPGLPRRGRADAAHGAAASALRADGARASASTRACSPRSRALPGRGERRLHQLPADGDARRHLAGDARRARRRSPARAAAWSACASSRPASSPRWASPCCAGRDVARLATRATRRSWRW